MLDTGEEQNMLRQTGYPSVDKPWLKYYSEEAINSVPFEGSIYHHIRMKNENSLNNYALQYFSKKITYNVLFEKVDGVAAALAYEGIKKGDIVILLMTSCPENVYLFLAINKIGAIANMINPLFSKKQIRDNINNVEAKLMFVLDQFYSKISDISKELCVKKTVIIPIVNSMPPITKILAGIRLNKKIDFNMKVISWKAFLQFKKEIASVNESELPAIMVYSSGTTGASKGIVLTNKGVNTTIAYYENTGFEYKREHTFLQIIPIWFSTGAVFCLFMPLCLGVCTILEPVFNEANFVKDILKYKPNMIMGATSQWLYLLKRLKGKKLDLSFITYPITGGEKILEKTETELNNLLSENKCNFRLIKGYGMCELGSTVTSDTLKYYKYGSVGFPITNVTVAAFDIKKNLECRYNERGEIRVLTPSRMKEYYKQPKATQKFFWKDSEGKEWGCTGDIGYVDEDGFVWVEGRATDYFVSKTGKKIFCFDIEDVILEDEQVEQCEVIGIEEENYSVPYAFIVIKYEQVDTEKILERCKSKLDAESVPVGIRVIDSFPVSLSGKRDLDKLRETVKENYM